MVGRDDVSEGWIRMSVKILEVKLAFCILWIEVLGMYTKIR